MDPLGSEQDLVVLSFEYNNWNLRFQLRDFWRRNLQDYTMSRRRILGFVGF